jgi:hypothetical protein
VDSEGSDGLADLEANIDLTTSDANLNLVDAITLNKWHHVAVSWTDDGDDEITIYIDGVNRGTSTDGSGSLASDSNHLIIGGDASNNFHGFIDEVKVYPYERTANEIKLDFQKIPGLHGTSASFGDDDSWLSDGLVGHWDLEEATGSATVDRSGNGNDGTLTNMQETGIADTASTTTTIVDTDGSLSSTDDAYNGMIAEITGGGSCAAVAGESRTISDYTGASNTITVGTAFSDVADNCGYIIKHQVGGKFGRALDFGGDSDYVNASDTLISAYPFTFSMWIKTTDTGGNNTTFSVADSSNHNNIYFIIINPGGNAQICAKSVIEGSICQDSTSTLNDGSWHYVTGIFQSNTERSIYVDGVWEATDTSTHTPNGLNLLDAWAIGGLSDASPSQYYSGSIDEVRVYNRALSPSEVQQLYRWAPGPVGYWKMDEGTGSIVYDLSGNGNDGSFTGSASWTQGKYGKGVEVSINGNVQDYINVADPDSGILDFSDTQDFTIETWFNVSSKEGSNANLLSKGGVTAGDDGYLMLISASQYADCRYADGSNLDSSGGTSTLVDGEWHHVVCVMDRDGSEVGTAGYHVFVDGILEGSDTSLDAGSAANTTDDLWLGERATSIEWNGAIDDTRIYNYARTAEQIVEDMNAGHPAPGSPIGSAVGHWKFDEGYGDSAYDSGTSGNNGNLGGSDSCPGDADTTACPAWTNDGKFGKALDFDTSGGVDDLVTINSQVYSVTEGAVSLWFKREGDGVGLDVLTGSYGGSGNQRAPTFITQGGNFQWEFGSLVSQDTSTDLSNDTWYHATLTYDSDFNITVYLNGDKVDSGTSSDPVDFYDEVHIGHYGNPGTISYFNGKIDEVKIYNFALTDDQVKTDYNQGKAQVLGSLSTDSSDNPSYSSLDAYCPPGQGSSCTGPVAEWKFDEKTGTSAFDTSKNGNTGTLTSGPIWQHSGACHSGPCIEFDGSNDYVSLPDNLRKTDTAGTIEAWVQFTGNGSANNTSPLVSLAGSASGDYAFALRRWETSGSCSTNKPQLRVYLSPDNDVCGSTTLNNNTWYHLVVTSDGSNYAMYVNGQPETLSFPTGSDDGSWVGDLSMGATTSIVDIGRQYYNGSPFSYTNALIDSVKLYNYARTPAQIAWSYNHGGPVGWWPFDSCSGSVAYDRSGNSNNGTIYEPGTGDNDGGVGTCSSGSGDEMWDNGTTGKRNASLDFDGTDDYISSASLPVTDYPLTITGWVNIPSSNNSNTMFFLGDSATTDDYFQVWVGEIPILRIVNAGADDLNGTINIEDGDWHHITAVYASATDRRLYVDGIADGTDTTNKAYPDSVDTWSIGRRTHPTPDHYMDGQIDDVRIYNYALTQQQINDVYNDGSVSFQ